MVDNYDYERLKAMAANMGYRVPDLLALSPKNDPFYKGTPGDWINGRWFAAVYSRAGYSNFQPPHLRRVHYWTVSQEPPVAMPNGKPYENTERCWEYLIEASKAARYLGLVAINGITDNKNPEPHINAFYDDEDPYVAIDIPELDDPAVNIWGIDLAKAQPYHLEIWCEKSTMNDVLLPICRTFNANLVTFQGEVSITSVCVGLLNRIIKSGNKPTRIWYISDFDPAGNSMPVAMSRKLEYALRNQNADADVRVRPLALTLEQVRRYKLPRIPIKETEKRAGKFEKAFGDGAVELDALEAIYPGRLVQIVRAEIQAYFNQAAADEVVQNRERLRHAVSSQVSVILDKYKDEIEALRDMQEELRAIHVDANEYDVDRYEPDVDEDDDWLFSSQRPYMDQINFYKAHKGIDSDLQ